MRPNPMLYFLGLSLLVFASQARTFSIDVSKDLPVYIPEHRLWRAVPELPDKVSFTDIEKHAHQIPQTSVLGNRGAILAFIGVKNPTLGPVNRYLKIDANYLDRGIAYWQPSEGDPEILSEFGQPASQTPHLAHSQVFVFTLPARSEGRLWVYLDAKQYAVPVNLTILTPAAFHNTQVKTNTTAILSVGVMLTLALIALLVFFKNRYSVALACAGYIGLHGVGWFAAAGSLGALLPATTFNPVYWGMLIFPFAIAAASQFTRLLFNCATVAPRLAAGLRYLSLLSVGIGVIGLIAAPFHVSFWSAHFIAATWVLVSITTGIYMVRKLGDYRARFYLLGNVCYGVSLIYYMVAHFYWRGEILGPESAVMIGLTVDCICILMSLAFWLHHQQAEYLQTFTLSRLDPLTNIGNRLAFTEALEQHTQQYCLAFIDADGLKKINDKYGHKAGDLFLVECSQLLVANLPGDCILYRTGGDEFVALQGVSLSAEAFTVEAQIRRAILAAERALQADTWTESGLSFGVASSREAESHSACLSLADERMYQQKMQKKAMSD